MDGCGKAQNGASNGVPNGKLLGLAVTAVSASARRRGRCSVPGGSDCQRGVAPNRVGRTGRAGNKGTAITFIAAEEEQYAPDLVKALRDSGAPIPEDLQVGR